jgi:predicted TIM-barrel fold metal-dependent hydrolase
MWGTDWTRTLPFLTYEQATNAFREHWPLSSTERAALMGESALRIYKWNRF